ncbi:hypothetical protein EVAR_48318_1 [Eumeta japonica]|uniref:Uncharacterized protein n=1 Tax=Eumeta variegata TaxID=151549 RepID=A0A4C1WNK0_EUMVA|nr:hypothetical protein EVAR_48318_1 [Eumeta japonica]
MERTAFGTSISETNEESNRIVRRCAGAVPTAPHSPCIFCWGKISEDIYEVERYKLAHSCVWLRCERSLSARALATHWIYRSKRACEPGDSSVETFQISYFLRRKSERNRIRGKYAIVILTHLTECNSGS